MPGKQLIILAHGGAGSDNAYSDNETDVVQQSCDAVAEPVIADEEPTTAFCPDASQLVWPLDFTLPLREPEVVE